MRPISFERAGLPACSALILTLLCSQAVTARSSDGGLSSANADNSLSSITIRGASPYNMIQGEIDLLTRNDQSRKQYLLTDIRVPIPSPALGIGSLADARKAQFTLSFSRTGEPASYADCSLELRNAGYRSVSYSSGLKSTGDVTLIRWGVCDDPHSPGHDSIFPGAQAGDLIVLKGPQGQTLWQSTIPAGTPGPARKRNTVLQMLEGMPYRVFWY